MPMPHADPEIQAASAVTTALKELDDDDARRRVLDWAKDRFEPQPLIEGMKALVEDVTKLAEAIDRHRSAKHSTADEFDRVLYESLKGTRWEN